MTPLDPQAWQRIRTLFHQAIELSPDARAAYLDEHCRIPEERAELDALLAAHRTDAFLEEPVASEGDGPMLEPLQPGQRIGPYVVERELGRGGMGVAYLARDVGLGRLVALKTVRSDWAHDPVRRARLEREARAAARVSHPGIATVYALERGDDSIFMVSEFVPGRTLRDRLSEGPLAERAVLDIALQLAHALRAAHAQGIVHRDLKPENVIQRDDGVIKILDFGLARVDSLPASRTHLTQTGMLLGTPGYMAPEQLAGQAVDFRTDLYAVGLLIHELSTGRHPYASADVDGESETRNLPEVRPPALASIVARCLQALPQARFASTGELVAALEAVHDGRTRSSPSSGAPPSARRSPVWWWRAHQLVLAIVCAVAAIPAWFIRRHLGGELGNALFFATLVAAAASVTLRSHLFFAAGNHPASLAEVRAEDARWVLRAEGLLILLLIAGAVAVRSEAPAVAAGQIVTAICIGLATWRIEPATTRAAFGGRDHDQR